MFLENCFEDGKRGCLECGKYIISVKYVYYYFRYINFYDFERWSILEDVFFVNFILEARNWGLVIYLFL